jgi:hypothetical protein
MNRKRGLALMPGMMLAVGLVLAGCGSWGDVPGTVTYTGFTAAGEKYELVIRENTARYAAQADDSYTLTITLPDGGIVTSTGKVTGTSGTLTLESSQGETFTVGLTDSTLTGITGTGPITGDDGTTAPLPEGPLTPTYDNITHAGLLITHIPAEYNGKYLSGGGIIEDRLLFSSSGYVGTIKGNKVSDGKTQIAVYTVLKEHPGFEVSIPVKYIRSSSGIFTFEIYDTELEGDADPVGYSDEMFVTLTGGGGTVKWINGSAEGIPEGGD